MARIPEKEEKLNLGDKAREMSLQPKKTAAEVAGKVIQPEDLQPKSIEERRKLETQINAVTFNQSTGDTVLTTALFGLSYGAVVGGFVATVAIIASNGTLALPQILGAMGLFGGFGAVASRMAAGERISAVKASAAGQQAAMDKVAALSQQVQMLAGRAGAKAPDGVDLSVPQLREIITPPKGECDENCQKERLFKLNRWLTAFAVGATIGLALWAAAAYMPGAEAAGGIGDQILTGLGNLVGKGKEMAWLGAGLLGGFTASTFGFNIPAISDKMKAVMERVVGKREKTIEPAVGVQVEPKRQPAVSQEKQPEATTAKNALAADEADKEFSHVDAQKRRDMNKPQTLTVGV